MQTEGSEPSGSARGANWKPVLACLLLFISTTLLNTGMALYQEIGEMHHGKIISYNEAFSRLLTGGAQLFVSLWLIERLMRKSGRTGLARQLQILGYASVGFAGMGTGAGMSSSPINSGWHYYLSLSSIALAILSGLLWVTGSLVLARRDRKVSGSADKP